MAAMVTTIAAMTYTHAAAPSIRRAGSVGSLVSAATPTRATTTGGRRRRAAGTRVSPPSTPGGAGPAVPVRRTAATIGTTNTATGTGPAGPGRTRMATPTAAVARAGGAG